MKKIYLYPLPVRIWHWLNACLIFILILTGIQLRIPGISIFSQYNTAVFLHKFFGFALTGSFLFWFLYYLLSGRLKKYYCIRSRDITGIPRQAFYYLFTIFQGKENPYPPSIDEKFNPLQKWAYIVVMFFLTPLIIITGIMFSDVVYFLNYIKFIGGLRILDAIHVATGYVFVIYLMVHIYMSTLGRKIYSHIKTMITGYEENIH
jgi:thiosulfate reductase cytochrome b subunit